MVFLLRLLVAKTLPSVHCLRTKRRGEYTRAIPADDYDIIHR
jgi:hypothetical protein